MVKLQITGQGIDITPALYEIIEKKFHRLEIYQDYITSIHITLQADTNHQAAETVIQVPGKSINAEAESEDMYKTIDLLVKKALAQLAKYKGKIIDREKGQMSHHRDE